MVDLKEESIFHLASILKRFADSGPADLFFLWHNSWVHRSTSSYFLSLQEQHHQSLVLELRWMGRGLVRSASSNYFSQGRGGQK